MGFSPGGRKESDTTEQLDNNVSQRKCWSSSSEKSSFCIPAGVSAELLSLLFNCVCSLVQLLSFLRMSTGSGSHIRGGFCELDGPLPLLWL